jgi:hypothetical protein
MNRRARRRNRESRRQTVRFMMLVKADKDFEKGAPPPPALMAAIGQLGQEMTKSGKLVQTGGLAPTAMGALLNLEGGAIRVTDGPFAESKEVIGGYAIMEAGSKAEAIELARRFLQVHADVMGKSYKGQIEVRQLFDSPPQG